MSLTVFRRRISPLRSETFSVKVGEYADGTPIGLTVRVKVGNREGQRIAMLGLQHGDEYCGLEVSNRVFDYIEPTNFRGSIISIPVANPLAFNASERASPPSMGYENLNMNRVWPVDSKGLLMERIASQIWEQIIEDSDIVVDLHEGGRAFMARYIHARGTLETERLVGEHNKRLYQLFGQGVPVLGGVNTRPSMMGSLSIQAGLVGIPTLSPELGGGGRLWEDLVQTGVQGIKNVMIGVGMLNEEPVGSDSLQLVSDGSGWPKTQHGGVMYNCCELGAIVEDGAVLGVLKDTTGQVLEKCKAPYKSVIFDTRYQPTVYPGDWTFHCGRLA